MSYEGVASDSNWAYLLTKFWFSSNDVNPTIQHSYNRILNDEICKNKVKYAFLK